MIPVLPIKTLINQSLKHPQIHTFMDLLVCSICFLSMFFSFENDVMTKNRSRKREIIKFSINSISFLLINFILFVNGSKDTFRVKLIRHFDEKLFDIPFKKFWSHKAYKNDYWSK